MVTGRRMLAGVLMCLLAMPGRVWAAEDSSASSDSSNSSTESSNDSNQSSQSSNDSSANSEQSSDETTQNTAEASGQSAVVTVGVGLVLLTVGAGVAGTVLLVQNTQQRKGEEPVITLMQFMRDNHALLVRDVSVGRGPVIDAWLDGYGLDAAEAERVHRALLEGDEQSQLLAALDGPVEREDALAFATAYYAIVERALGAERVEEILRRQ